MVGAAAAFWILSLFTRREHVTPHDLALLFFASLFGVTLNQGFFITGVSLTSPIDASVVTTTTPIITMILAALYLKEPITSKKVMGIFHGSRRRADPDSQRRCRPHRGECRRHDRQYPLP